MTSASGDSLSGENSGSHAIARGARPSIVIARKSLHAPLDAAPILDLPRRDPHELDGVADHIGERFSPLGVGACRVTLPRCAM